MNIYSNKRRPVKAGATLERENDMEIVLRDDDGAQLRVVYRPNFKGYVIRRTLNDGGNGRFDWDQSKEIFDTAEEAKQAALDGRVTFNFKGRKTPSLPVQSSTRRRSVKASSNGWKETDYSVFMDGSKQRMSKYTKEYDGYRVMVRPEYNDKIDILSWVVYLFDIDDEPKRLEAFETSYDAMDFADYELYDLYVRPINSACHSNSSVKSSTRRRSVKTATYNDNSYTVYYELYSKGKTLDATYDTEKQAYDAAVDMLQNGEVQSDIEIRKCYGQDTAKGFETVDSEWLDTIRYTDNVKASTRRRSVKCNADKLDDIAYVMQNYINGNGFVLEQDLGNGKYEVSYQGTPVTIEFDPSFSEYVYFINGEGPYSHNSYEYIYDDIREYVDSITDEWGNVIASANKAVQASEDYKSPNTDVIAVLEDNGFEYANEPTAWWDKFMWLGFGATYNDETQQAYVWWNPNGNTYELPFNYSVETVSDANAMCDDLYTWDEYDIGELLCAGLPLIGATSHDGKLDEFDYDNGMGDTAYINVDMGSGTVTDVYGEVTEYHNLQDLLEAAGILR